jgi:hypothetical protein
MVRLVVSGAVFFLIAVSAGIIAGLSLASEQSAAPVVALESAPAPITSFGFAQVQRADDLEMAMSVTPGYAGRNDVNFYVRDVNGDDRPYTKLAARISYLDGPPGAQAFQPVQLHEGHWPLEALELRLAGRWQIEANVSRDGLPDARFRFEIALSHP